MAVINDIDLKEVAEILRKSAALHLDGDPDVKPVDVREQVDRIVDEAVHVPASIVCVDRGVLFRLEDGSHVYFGGYRSDRNWVCADPVSEDPGPWIRELRTILAGAEVDLTACDIPGTLCWNSRAKVIIGWQGGEDFERLCELAGVMLS